MLGVSGEGVGGMKSLLVMSTFSNIVVQLVEVVLSDVNQKLRFIVRCMLRIVLSEYVQLPNLCLIKHSHSYLVLA